MNRFRRTFLLAGLLLAAAAIAGVAQPRLGHSATAPASADRTITVTGSGSVTAVPDRASFSFSVDTRGATASAALSSNADEAQAVVGALKNAGVAAADLQTTEVSLDPQTSQDGTKIIGYAASSSVSVTVPIGQAGAIVDAAVKAGADGVSGPSLDVSDQDALYAQALKNAVANAQSKAMALADASGLQLGAVQTVVEGSAPSPVVFGATAKAPDASGSVPIEPGSQEIDATVTVTYSAS
ncbi:MAG TPA: SIMPL domain-containing protein [Gaiellaceae bacterium]|nr:SIMPL domain-containing protein [Gaiellaceae bacterium]